MHYVGIDWADASHQIAIVTSEGDCISEFVVNENDVGLQMLHKHLHTLAPVRINIERPDGLLVDWLIQQGFQVFVTPPRIAARRCPHASKDDRGDARLLAHLLRMKDEDCRILHRHSSRVEDLLQVLRAYEQVQRQQLRTTNQLRQILKQYYPIMLRLFSDLRTKVALAFLASYPTPLVASKLSTDELSAFLRSQRYTRSGRVSTIHQMLQTTLPQATVWQGSAIHAQALVPVIQTLNQQVQGLKQEIQKRFLEHPEADWWSSLPGAGELTTPRLLALIGDNRSVFPSAEVLQARAGTVPVTRRSGKAKAVRFRWACDKALRKAMMDFARNSLSKSGWAQSYYMDQRQQGHLDQRATRPLANRWARIIWTLWQRREMYDETKHVANRSRKGRAATHLPDVAAPL
jgi:transposase